MLLEVNAKTQGLTIVETRKPTQAAPIASAGFFPSNFFLFQKMREIFSSCRHEDPWNGFSCL